MKRRIITQEFYKPFVARLDIMFFDHLENLTSLELEGTLDGPLGTECIFNIDESLNNYHAPRLKRLSLKYYFINYSLLMFLIEHSDVLEVRSSLLDIFVNLLNRKSILHSLFTFMIIR